MLGFPWVDAFFFFPEGLAEVFQLFLENKTCWLSPANKLIIRSSFQDPLA